MAIDIPEALDAARLKSLGFTDEFIVLLMVVRTGLGNNNPDIARRACQRCNDWGAVVRLAERHKALPRLYEQLSTFMPDAAPGPVMKALSEASMRNRIRALRAVKEIVEIKKALAGMRIMFLKGATLSGMLFGDVGRRHSGDVDLMAAPSDVQAADRLLRGAGYSRVYPKRSYGWAGFATMSYLLKHYKYLSPRGVTVELHLNLYQYLPMTREHYDRLYLDSQEVSVGGEAVRTLSDPELVAFLSYHGAFHAWYRLLWLVDMPYMIERASGVDWARMLGRNAGHARVAVGQMLVLVNQLLGVHVPVAARGPVLGYGGFKSAADEALALMRLSGGNIPRLPFAYRMRICSTARVRCNSLIAMAARHLIGLDDDHDEPDAMANAGG